MSPASRDDPLGLLQYKQTNSLSLTTITLKFECVHQMPTATSLITVVKVKRNICTTCADSQPLHTTLFTDSYLTAIITLFQRHSETP